MRLEISHRYVETIIISLGTLFMCLWFNPSDPLFVHASFPWIWFIPILIALRHGAVFALISVAFVIVFMMQTIQTGQFNWNDYRLWLLGGLTLVFLCAEYQSLWKKRQWGLWQKESYLSSRLHSLSRSYQVLKLSHDRLEESLIVKPATLREALSTLRTILKHAHGELTPEIARQYMEVLSFHASFSQAGLYLKNKQWDLTPIASVGKEESLLINDALVKKALSQEQTSYVALNSLDKNEISEYLAVIPLKTSENQIIGMLIIKEMTFLALNEETLKTLTLFLAYIADDLLAAQQAVALQKVYPDCPAEFASELYKSLKIWQIAKLDSALIVYYLPVTNRREDILHTLKENKRGLDLNWETKKEGTIILLILMPLTERSMLTGYFDRMQILFNEKYQLNLAEYVKFQYRYVSSYNNLHQLLDELIDDTSI